MNRFKKIVLFSLGFFILGGLIAILILISITGEMIGFFAVKPNLEAYLLSIGFLGLIFGLIGFLIALFAVRR